MPIVLEPANPEAGYPEEAIAPIGARRWGRLLWQLYYWDANLLYDWEANLHTFRYDNYGYLIPAHTCRAVADTIRRHLDELPPDERASWEAQVPYWEHSGGFYQRGKP